MDILSLIGLVLAACSILIGAVLKGAGIHSLLSGAAFMIVIVGTVAAICVQTPLHVMKRALSILPWVFRPPTTERDAMIKRMVEWSNTARKQGLLGLEPELSDNLSVRLVKYFEPVGMVAINYYQNRVKGLFQTEEMTAEEFGYTGPEFADYIFRTTTTVGGEAINIRGYELEFNHSLDYLPSPFDGLTIRGSYMINDPDIPIVRSADQLATLALAYRKGPVKLYFNTVWTDDKYRTTSPSWFDALWDTNLSGSYELHPGWEAFFSVRNLIDSSRNVIVPGSLATSGPLEDHSAIFIHGGMNATIGVRARF